jgi:hypothetical protein
MVTAAQGRSYEHTLCAGRSLELSGVARLLWGAGWYGRRVHALPQLAVCLRDHGLTVPESLGAVACHQADEHQEWRFAQGENRFAALYHYKGRDFAMGSAAHYRWNEWGYQETVLHLRLGQRPEAAVWINHPGETIQFGYGRPSFWGGCGTLPRVHQYRGLAVLGFSTFEEQPEFTHAWFPVAEFDESTVRGHLAMARSGRGAVVLLGNTDFQLVKHGPSANAELRQYGRNTRWIVRVCEALELDTVEARFAALSANDGADGSLVIEDPNYGTVIFRKDGSAEAEGRVVVPRDFTVAGEVVMLAAN